MFQKLNKLFYLSAYTAILGATVAAGLRFAILKNKQTLVLRDIDKVERRTREQDNLLNQYKADLQNSNNRFVLKNKIKALHTDLVPIKKLDVITIPSVSHTTTPPTSNVSSSD